MKQLLILFTLLSSAILSFAQPPRLGSINFLGIPVDGTKDNVETQLIKKGFKRNFREDCFEGRFNGQDVQVAIVSNKDLV